jgi:hypothetical protein
VLNYDINLSFYSTSKYSIYSIQRSQYRPPLLSNHYQEMIPHHQMAVMMSQHLLFNAVHPEMKQLAQAIIQAQTKEINEMQSWYQQ